MTQVSTLSPTSKKPESHHLSILLVEDESTMRELIKFVLGMADDRYDVRDAGNYQEALTLALEERPHLLLLDYQFPGGNGLALFDELHARRTYETIPALLMSADLPPQHELRKRNMAELAKPFMIEELVELVQQLLLNQVLEKTAKTLVQEKVQEKIRYSRKGIF